MSDKRKIVSCTIVENKNFRLNGDRAVMAMVKGAAGIEGPVRVTGFYSDELHFSASEFVGLTVEEACELHVKKDVAFMQAGLR